MQSIDNELIGNLFLSVYFNLVDNINTEEDTIPPIFVQPFLDNALERGIANVKQGEILLRFTKEGDYMAIEMSNNGVGITSMSNEGHVSLSTTIIQERMDLFNKSLKRKIQLEVSNLTNQNGGVSGTKVELKVPFGYI